MRRDGGVRGGGVSNTASSSVRISGISMWPGPQSDDGPRGVARHGVPCHNFNPAMHVVAENILVSLLTSARGRVVRAHGQLASCKCASMMSTDYQAMMAGQAGNWGVAVRMRMCPRPPGVHANHAA